MQLKRATLVPCFPSFSLLLCWSQKQPFLASCWVKSVGQNPNLPFKKECSFITNKKKKRNDSIKTISVAAYKTEQDLNSYGKAQIACIWLFMLALCRQRASWALNWDWSAASETADNRLRNQEFSVVIIPLSCLFRFWCTFLALQSHSLGVLLDSRDLPLVESYVTSVPARGAIVEGISKIWIESSSVFEALTMMLAITDTSVFS